MEHHPISGLFPMMADTEYEALREDIRHNGLREPILLFEGMVLDGRNRLKACAELGLDPQAREWDGAGSAVAMVLSRNLHRRHLTPSQRAACAVEALSYFKAEAKERQQEGGEKGGKKAGRGRPADRLTQKVGEAYDRHEGLATQQAAELFGTNRQYVADAEKVKEDDPELFEEVKAGNIPVKAAVNRVRRKQEDEAKAGREAALAIESAHCDRFSVDHGDCIEWLDARPVDSIDLVFGSPPYEQQRLYLEEGSDPGIARDTQEWVDWMVEVYRAALRCCTGLVAFVVEGPTKDYRWSVGPALLMVALHREGITLRKPPLYHRVGIPGSGGPDWLRNDYEFIICATRGGRLPWSDNTAMGSPCVYDPGGDPSHRTRDGSRVNREDLAGYASMEDRENIGPHRARQQNGRAYQPPEIANPGNVIRCLVGGGNMGSSLSHENEAPFPESLAEFFIRSFCPPGGITCDPFMGGGTTGAMAIKNGRRFAGCDVRPSQVRLTRRRIANVQKLLIV